MNQKTLSNLAKYFLRTIVFILIVTASMKFLSVFHDAEYLKAKSRLFEFITNRQLIAFTAVIEVAVVIYLLSGTLQVNKLGVVAWLSTLFLTYRFMLFVMKIPLPCSCLGNAADWLPVKLSTIELTMKGVLGYMLVGSLGLLFAQRSLSSGSPAEPLPPTGAANINEAV
jgi:hypothetical protein